MNDGGPASALFDRAARTRAAAETLVAHYGRPRWAAPGGRPDPLPRLIRAIVAQHTSRANQEQALATLYARFPDPALLAEAPLHAVEEAIRSAGLARSKAPRLKGMVARLLEQTAGTLDLAFLYEIPVEEARQFLLDLPGIGPLSAALVLLFEMGRPVLPVNTGLHRVARRVGMVPPNVDAERSQDLLQRQIPDDEIYAFHLNMVRLARERCRRSRPRCDHCPLAPHCLWLHGGGGGSDA